MKNLLLLITISSLLLSCNKESTDPDPVNTVDNSKIVGTWTFVNMSANAYYKEVWLSSSDSMRIVRTSSFVSINNEAEMTIDDSTMTIANFIYNVNSTYTNYEYRNGILQVTSQIPYQSFYNRRTRVTPYKMITPDSMYVGVGRNYFPDSLYMTIPAGGQKILRVADTLYVSSTEETISGSSQGGNPATRTDYRIQTMRYTKKP